MRVIPQGLNRRMLLFPLISLVTIGAITAVSVRSVGDITLEQSRQRARVAVETVTSIVAGYEQLARSGAMPLAAAQAAAKDAIRAAHYDGSNYVTAITEAGLFLVHPNPKIQDTNMIDMSDPNGVPITRNLLAVANAGGGFTSYSFAKSVSEPTPIEKSAYALFTKDWRWMISSGVYLDGVAAAEWDQLNRLLPLIAALTATSIGLALWVGRRIARPIVQIAEATHAIAMGTPEVTVPCLDRTDEIGRMASAVDVLKRKSAEATHLAAADEAAKTLAARDRQEMLHRLADGFEQNVARMVDVLTAGSSELETTSRSMAATASTANDRASSVADAAKDASNSIQSVAAAAEELASSINEIGRQVEHSAAMSVKAVSEAQRTDETVRALAEAAERIGQVVGLISTIASQTNLLALNATIEAARAGDAGKGFAVVASEVKNLANQTAQATGDIEAQITHIQSATRQSVEAIRGITATIGEVSAITTTIAAAVEQQGAATAEIARSVQRTAQAAADVTTHIGGVSQAANDTGAATGVVLGAASNLSKQTEQISEELTTFVASVRAA
jgi:methyl-accepting chemotaxis protein